jgi:hypothetical protein
MLKLLDFFFIGFHTLLIIFNLFGWILRKTRKLNLISLLLTGISWFVLGLFYGIGYCPLTDWHFKILERMGQTNLPSSYVVYLLKRFTGIEFRGAMIDKLTLMLFIFALILSVVSNIKQAKSRNAT